MSWLWEKSPFWRQLVRVTRQSPPAMVAFTAFMFVVPYQLGKVVLWTTNPEQQTALEKRLRERSTLEHRMLAKANRDRLAVLLNETELKSAGDERYAAALRGESLGTHSRGTTTGAQGIRDEAVRKQ